MFTKSYLQIVLASILTVILSSCSTFYSGHRNSGHELADTDYASRLPQHINTGEKTVLVDPNVHAWGAYDSDGSLLRAGLTTAGGDWCPDIGRRCHTGVGTFRIHSLGSAACKSSIYPLHRGGAPMPYCMFFNRSQGLHGSYEVVEGNISHGCVRMQVSDAEWMRFNFATVGTKVIVKPY